MTDARANGEIRAAGALLWRPSGRGREVALVHRRRYDDWSFPKGKRERGEHVPLTAGREVAEESGGGRARRLDPRGGGGPGRLASVVSGFGPARVISWPAERCVATVGPYATRTGAGLEIETALAAERADDEPGAGSARVAAIVAA